MMWSQAIVFLASFSDISLASDDMRVMNSTQHSMRRSLASLAKATPPSAGRISPTIFWTVAAWLSASWYANDVAKPGRRDGPSYLWEGIDHRCLEPC